MSADDFQSKYASVMESMLKSAIAETTKLFENMVDELKEEISKIKKENEDLKTRCYQYETGKGKPVSHTGESHSVTEPGDASEKCDTAIQCDLVPCRTILVEECEPLMRTELERHSQQCNYNWNNYSLQEHNYVNYRDRNSQMEFVVVKEESQFKQEGDDPEFESGSSVASVGGAPIGRPNINNSSTAQITVPQKTNNPVVLQLSCLETESSKATHNQSTDMQHSLVISLKDALRDDIKEELEIVEVAKQGLATSEGKQMFPHTDSTTTHNKQTHFESASVNTNMAGEELNKEVPEREDDSKPKSSTGRKRGRPPKKTRQKRTLPNSTDKDPKHQMDLKTKEVTHASPPLVTSSVMSSSIKESPDTLKDDIIDVESLSSTSLLSSFSSGEQPTFELQEHCPEVEKDLTAAKISTTSLAVPLQASLGLLKACQTSVSLQDALLLVEAMNQSTLEKNDLPLKVASQSQIMSSSVSSVGSFKAVVETPTVQQMAPVETLFRSNKTSSASADLTAATSSKVVDLQNVVTQQPSDLPPSCTASSSLSSASAAQTVIKSLPLPLIHRPAPNKGPRTIIILPRPSLTSDIAKAGSQNPHSPVNPATLNKRHLPPLSTAATPPLSSVPKKTIKVVYRKQEPVMSLQSSTIFTDHQYVAPQTITIVSKAMPSGVSREPETIALAASLGDKESIAPVHPESSKHLMSELQESSSSYSGHPTSTKKLHSTTDDLNSSGQISSSAESTIAAFQEHSGSELSADGVPPSVSSSLTQATERKLRAVVRLTRLPLSISTKESVLISTLVSKGIVQEKSSYAHVSDETDRLIPDLEHDILCSDMEDEQEDAFITQEDTSDPHVQMSKAQFLAKLSVSPLENEPNINEISNPRGTKSIVSRLRSHLQAHLESKRSSTKQVAGEEMRTENKNKKPHLIVQDSTKIPAQALYIVSPSKIACMQSLGLHKGGGELSGTSRMSVSTKEFPNIGFKKPCSGTHSVMKSISESPRQLSSPKESTSINVTKSTSVSPKNSPSNKNNTISLIKRSSSVSPRRPTSIGFKITGNDSTPKSAKSSSLSPKRSTKVSSSPNKTESSAEENNSSPEMLSTQSCSTSPKSNPKTKSMKRECSSFTPRRYIVTADSSITEITKCEPESPSPKCLKMAKNDPSPPMTAESNPKKPRQLQGHCGQKTNHKVASAKKLTNSAKGRRRVGKKRGSYKKKKLELPVISSGVVKKWRAKVWYPPTLPPNEKPMTDIIRPPPLKVEYRIPDIPLSAPPIVSPLQPLAVIGRHLLRNQCGECGRVFSNSNALESHVSLHKIYRPFSCKLCGKYFPDSKTFKRHDRVHRNGRIHVCQHCGKGFVYRFGLSKHIQMVHGRIRPFICQVCGNGFYTKRDVEIHIRIHTGEKPFQCHICERRFTRKVELNVHLRWHNGEKRHWCQYCGKGFLDYNNLKRHRYTHTGEKPYSCPHCPKNFTQTGHLKKHVKTVHKK
ncbi:uncharacterized protein LOC129367044 [Poeciliopsis prolifica]|uniref:uncharacterized protein LOC129367044 n=1 Tax=Poeciliopsis prolifica TaxID=188132 RepID=UPI00241302F9|nr:uncharacterized protein LOC129367044 [Poeciliopsis prolifica]XP_054897226.1 uncharacterized protein LOC129367044 [Poeciliopsis prolifica]